MAEEKETLQVNQNRNISWKYLSQLYFEGSNSESERDLVWRNTLTRPFSAREGQSARLPRTMQPDDNVTQYLLFLSLSQLQLLDCVGCLSTALAFSSWPRSWSEVKKLSWPPHVSLLRLAPGKGVRQFDVWGESSFKRPLPSYDKSDFSSSPLKVLKLAESVCRNCQKIS